MLVSASGGNDYFVVLFKRYLFEVDVNLDSLACFKRFVLVYDCKQNAVGNLQVYKTCAVDVFFGDYRRGDGFAEAYRIRRDDNFVLACFCIDGLRKSNLCAQHLQFFACKLRRRR